MDKLNTIFIAAIATLSLAALAGCETETCRSACNRIYEECGMPPMLDCESAEISSVDCSAADEWKDHQKNECITDCERALYTPATADNESDNRWQLANEEDAARFIDCVVNHPLDSCKTDYWVECQWIKW